MGENLVTYQEFHEQVLPELHRRWDRHCFCSNGAFLKLIAFDFRDYDLSPTALGDAEFLIAGLLLQRCEPETGDDDAPRAWRCRTCASLFQVIHEQYSIAMECTSARRDDPLPMASTGRYLMGYRYFAGEEETARKITDFQPAASVETYIDDLSRHDKP